MGAAILAFPLRFPSKIAAVKWRYWNHGGTLAQAKEWAEQNWHLWAREAPGSTMDGEK